MNNNSQMAGLRFFGPSKEALLEQLSQQRNTNCQKTLAFCDLNMFSLALASEEFHGKIASFDYLMDDGSFLAILKVLFSPKSRFVRIPGPDFFHYVLTQDDSYRHFFLGSTQQTLDALNRRAHLRNPRLKVCGSYSPPFEKEFSNATTKKILEIVNAANPDFLWVSFGCPKQEAWIHANRHQLSARVLVAIGAAFEFYSGRVRRAPAWIRILGFEFLFRMVLQPRIIKRSLQSIFRIVTNLYKLSRKEN